MAQFAGGNTAAADLVYQEPRMVTVTMSPRVGSELLDGTLRAAYIGRSVNALETNLPVGTPYRVLIAPGISTETSLGTFARGSAISSVTLAAVTEAASITWTVASGYTLPSGLSLSTAGVLTGTPSSGGNTAGTKLVLITATDSNGATATKLFTITLT